MKTITFQNIRVSIEASDPAKAYAKLKSAMALVPNVVDWESDLYCVEDEEGYCGDERSTAELMQKETA